MTDSQYISVRETAQILGITEKKVMDLIDDEKLQAYKIANQFLRLKKNEVNDLKNTGKITTELVIYPYSLAERIRDFFYFNDFYLVCAGIIAVLLFIVLQK
jgi:excisionase family DNA binding protein